MAWRLTSVDQPLWISAGGSRSDTKDIEKAPVIAVAVNTELQRNEVEVRYLVADPKREPQWVDAQHVMASGVRELGPSADAKVLDLVPIRKVGVAFVGASLTWAALQFGIEIPAEGLNEAASSIVGLVLAYLVPDPRVVPASSAKEGG